MTYDALCLDCGWRGPEDQLKAQACPICDGRVRDDLAQPPSDWMWHDMTCAHRRFGSERGACDCGATHYCVRLRLKSLGTVSEHTFTSDTARQTFILTLGPWADVESEWMA